MTKAETPVPACTPASAPDGEVRLCNVSYTYPGAKQPALRDVSLQVPAGQCMVITGQSGCGKTTLTRLVNGLVPHVYDGDVKGTVHVGPTDVAQWTPDELGVRVGSVFQNPRSQFVNLDVASEIAFGCENLGLPQPEIARRVQSAAATLGIGHLLTRSVEQLSGGQKQAVILASALAMHPDVFVMDEPTASLDVESMQRLSHVVAALKASGKTVIVSEHRLWWLAGVADRVVLMENGTIAGDWTAAEYALLAPDERARRGMRAWSVAEMEGPLPARPLSTAPSNAPANPLLQATALEVGYRKGQPILQGLDLALQPGTVTGLLGKNGAGKTTLMRCLAGLTRESDGAVALEGRPLPFRHRPGQVHLVMQEPGYQLFADSAMAELEAAGTADAAQALEDFQLTAVAQRHPLALSGGQRQRLAIAAGIAQGARVLVLDEPTSGLDRENMLRVARALQQVAAKGAAIAVVTHDYEFLCAACSHVALLSGGAITARYPLDNAHAPLVREQLGFSPR